MTGSPGPERPRRSLWQRPVIWVGTCLAVILAVLGLRYGERVFSNDGVAREAADPVIELLPSDIVTVSQQDLRRLLPLTGTVQALRRATVKAKVGGEIRDILVREGESVTAGQVVVRMDPREYQARLDQARGALAAAQGQLEIAQTARDNNRALLDKGFISRNAFETAANQFAIAKANVDSARAAMAVAKEAFADTTLRAPITGIVSRRAAQPGEKVSSDNPLLDIVNLQQLELAAPVPAAEISGVSVGQEVSVRVAGSAEIFPGKVARINPSTEAGSRSILVYVHLDNPRQTLRNGMFAEAQLTVARRTDVVAIPQTAVRRQAGQAFVYAIRNGKLAQQGIRLGGEGMTSDGPAVEVDSGIAAGERIVRNNLGTLPLGAVVQLVEPDAAASAAAGVRQDAR